MKENDERDQHCSTANGALQQATNPAAAKLQVNVAEYGDGDADDKRRQRNRRQRMVLEIKSRRDRRIDRCERQEASCPTC